MINNKVIRYIVFGLLIVFFLIGIFFLGIKSVPTGEKSPYVGVTEEDIEKLLPTMEVHYIDVGHGDCILIKCESSAMLIDAGGEETQDTVVNYLKRQGIERLDYVVGTHYDVDHIGGMDRILEEFTCGTVIMPDQKRGTKSYKELAKAVKNGGYSLTYPKVGDTYNLACASFTILAPTAESYETNNDYSIVLRVVHGEKRFLFTGDAEKTSEAEMLELQEPINADVIKISHHGSKNASTKDFLAAVNPEYAVISCSRDDDMGHPNAKVLTKLKNMGVKVFRTDEQGTIVCYSNGIKLLWNVSPSETWKPGRETENKEESAKELE